LATWLLEHFRADAENVHITGDLIEAYQRGRSRTWYWKEVLAAIVIGVCDEIRTHPFLALRAISVGWAICLLFDYAVGPASAPLVRRYVGFTGYPFGPSMLIWFATSLLVRAASGWIVARLHPSHWITTLLLFTTTIFAVQLRALPWIWLEAMNTLTNIRFLPYLIYLLELQFIWPAAILFGGALFRVCSGRRNAARSTLSG